MEDKIIAFITQYIPLTDDEIATIKEQNLIKYYKKGSTLLSEGEYSKECFFVLKGCIRSFHIIDGEERTTEFYTENQTINPVSYLTKEPSAYYLSCLEDSVIALGSDERNKKLLEKVPKLGSMIINLSSTLIAESSNSLDDFKNLSPEMRYRKLMETRPKLFQRVPLYHIASYLGITPESLSRMRKRISSNL
ncbi:MAG: Crp/Fnr family transcriptional regulator [Saprospiraceae bacterium]|nr:Crp/Fnr family transcriptional regulator [Lewinella sp.]